MEDDMAPGFVRSAVRTVSAIVLGCSLPLAALAQTSGWVKAGSSPKDYEAGVDSRTAFTGASSGYIRSASASPEVFGTYMQMMDATEYRGKRVRMTAQVKTENVAEWAGMWLRVDQMQKPVAFDNMANRPIKGTNDWMPVSIVLDVDANATGLAFGVLLAGRGAAWVDDVNFEVVGRDVAVTDITKMPAAAPRNLDFENRAPVR
jgi:hypothetical protein